MIGVASIGNDKWMVHTAQAFCRVAAVAGATYVLRRPLAALQLLESSVGAGDGGRVCGVRTGSGQELRCGAFAGNADAFVGLRVAGGAAGGSGSCPTSGAGNAQGAAVARAVAITDGPLQQAWHFPFFLAWRLLAIRAL